MTGRPIQLLVVDQHHADVRHLQSALQADPLHPVVIVHAGTLAEGLGLLDRAPFDVVLCDPGLPDCQGLATIEHLRRAAPQLPIMVWTEANAEAEALAALRAGAQDCLSKDACGLALMGRALRYAMERQQIHMALVEREQRRAADAEQLAYQAKLLDHVHDAVIGTDAALRVTYWNPAAEALFGWTAQEALGREPVTLFHTQIPNSSREAVMARLMREGAYDGEAIYQCKDGRAIHAHVKSVLLRDPHGAFSGLVSSIHDITARTQVEAALRASEARFATIFERSPIAISISRLADSRMVLVNAAALELIGLRREDVLGHTSLELGLWALPEDRPQIREEVIQQRLGRGTETILRLPNGSERNVILSGEVVELNGEPCALAQLTDITDLKTTQQQLIELNRTLEERVQQRTAEVQDLYEHAPTGYHSLDAAGAFLRVNQTELDWLGYTHDELIGRPFTDIITPESRAIFAANFPTFKQHGWVRNLEFELIRKDGSTFPVMLSATAIHNASGAYVMSRSTLFDITQRNAAEAALRESETQNRLLFEAAPDAVVLFDPAGRVARMNRAFAVLTGYPATQLIGQHLAVWGVLSEQDMRHLTAGEVQGCEPVTTLTLTLRRADGSTRDVGVRVFWLPLRGAPHALTTIRDITVEKQAEAALRLANAELARAARAKDEFLANMSHELRTPLAAILGYSEILLEQIHGPLTAGQQKALRQITASGQHLLSLITDILDLAKVEAGAEELQIAPVDVAEVCQASLLLVKQQAAKKALGLELTLASDLATVQADPQRLKQMLVNLLANAVKFTPEGGKVGLEVAADAEAGMVRFTVADTGIGIAPEDLARLFHPFVQLDSSLSRRHEGTGLGLALVRHLADLHGGSITATSTVGVGSHFTIRLPYRPAGTPYGRQTGGQ